MSIVTLRGTPAHTNGVLPSLGAVAPHFTLTNSKLEDLSLSSWSGRSKVLNIFPSVDTSVCAASVRRFNAAAAERPHAVVINVSADLPFALARFCGAEGIANAVTVSSFRSSFARDYGVDFVDGPFRGLCARAVVVLDAGDRVVYTELVPEISNEPKYDEALRALR